VPGDGQPREAGWTSRPLDRPFTTKTYHLCTSPDLVKELFNVSNVPNVPPQAHRHQIPTWLRITLIGALALFAIGAVIIRVILFSQGILYGESTAKMASLAVAAIVVTVGAVIMKIIQSGRTASGTEQSAGSIASSLATVIGLALAAYSAAELLAPNTPVVATAAACPGTPVYGARFFAQTTDLGVNARSGPGRVYVPVRRYAPNCTLGFDGYCIGSIEPDSRLKTPDDRWLIVHGRSGQLISSAVVLSQSPERDLGQDPSSQCRHLGGLPLPQTIQDFAYNRRGSTLSASAPGAAAVGYAIAAPASGHPSYVAIGLATGPPTFKMPLTTSSVLSQLAGTSTNNSMWVGAAVCLADSVPVVKSLHALRLTLRKGHVIDSTPAAMVPSTVRTRLAQLACGSKG